MYSLCAQNDSLRKSLEMKNLRCYNALTNREDRRSVRIRSAVLLKERIFFRERSLKR